MFAVQQNDAARDPNHEKGRRKPGGRGIAFCRSNTVSLILRACESIDFCVSRHESNQGLRTHQNVEFRIDSHALRSGHLVASRRMAAACGLGRLGAKVCYR
jgi:hypothetical protein